jgi:hypothetical protein
MHFSASRGHRLAFIRQRVGKYRLAMKYLL